MKPHSLKRKRVALLIETSRAYGRELLQGVREYVAGRDHWSITIELRDLESGPPSWLRSWKGDGVLCRSGDQKMIRAVEQLGLPTVELRASTQTLFPFVGIDNQLVGEMVARHLMERGLRHFGVYELDTEQFFLLRSRSFLKTVNASGFECDQFRQSGHREKPSEWESQQQQLVQWIRQLPKPAGVLACTDQLGCWLLEACREGGVSVPDEVAVVGVENDATLCSLSTPPLSSVRLGGEQTGYAAAHMLDQLMSGKKRRKTALLLPPADLIVRESSDLVAIDHPLVSRALQLMRKQATAGVNVEQIVTELEISRSTLEREFRATLGRTPNAELLRLRLVKASELLRETDMTLELVALHSGFSRASYLSYVFAQEFGLTPGTYRKRQRRG